VPGFFLPFDQGLVDGFEIANKKAKQDL